MSRTKPLTISLLGATLALCAAFAMAPGKSRAAAEAPRFEIDRQAGVKFLVPFARSRRLSGTELAATLNGRSEIAHAASHLQRLGLVGGSSGAHITSIVHGPQELPVVIVATRTVASGITGLFVDAAMRRDAHALTELRALRDLRFDPQTLRGEADLMGTAQDAGWRAKSIVQLVRGRVTTTYFVYRNARDVDGFQTIERSFTVGNLSRLDPKTLHVGAAQAESGFAWTAVLSALFFAGILAAAVVTYRKMGHDPVLTAAKSRAVAQPSFANGPSVEDREERRDGYSAPLVGL